MINRLITVLAFAAMAITTGCTDNFAEMNESKTASTTTKPDGLLTLALVRGSMDDFIYQRAQMLHGNHYMQYYANKASYFNTDIYNPNEAWANEIWKRLYSDGGFAILHHITEAVKLSQEQGNKHKEAIARIWRAYMFQIATDLYGDIPYSQAFKSNAPVFDTQKEIYYDLLEQLKIANEYLLINENFQKYGSADIMFQGDIEKWRRFGNSLRLRIAMRITNVDLPKAQEVFAELQTLDFMRNNEDNAKMVWMESSENHYNLNPLLVINRFNEFRVSKRLIDELVVTNDPRLSVYAEPALSDNQYRGLENGIDLIELAGYNDDYFKQFSTIGKIFIEPTGPTYNFTYAEYCFLRAEAALKGYLSGDAETFYKEGVKAAMNMYRITDQATIDTYLLQAGIAYNPSIALKQIITQKWLALINNGLETWAERRRTGYPTLNPLKYAGGSTGGVLPRRLLYSSDERLYNYDNVQKASEKLANGDNILSRVWWDNQNN